MTAHAHPPDEPRHLFVYGTLRPGEERWPILARFVVAAGHPDAVSGGLYDTGLGYPGARFETSSVGSLVLGQTLALLDHSRVQALEILDEVEGAVDGHYRRVVVRTRSGVTAHAYEHGGGTPLVPIPHGDWIRWRPAARLPAG